MFYKTTDHHGLRYDPFNALVAPRPIGWISSVDKAGQVNLAPFSYFNAISKRPPMVMFACNAHHLTAGGDKDTLKNVRETGEFVANIATLSLKDAVNLSSKPVDRDCNEFDLTGLTPVESSIVTPPRVAESPANLECKVIDIVPMLEDPATGQKNTVVFGHVLAVHIQDQYVEDGYVRTDLIQPLARLGYFEYSAVEETFTIPRPE